MSDGSAKSDGETGETPAEAFASEAMGAFFADAIKALEANVAGALGGSAHPLNGVTRRLTEVMLQYLAARLPGSRKDEVHSSMPPP